MYIYFQGKSSPLSGRWICGLPFPLEHIHCSGYVEVLLKNGHYKNTTLAEHIYGLGCIERFLSEAKTQDCYRSP